MNIPPWAYILIICAAIFAFRGEWYQIITTALVAVWWANT